MHHVGESSWRCGDAAILLLCAADSEPPRVHCLHCTDERRRVAGYRRGTSIVRSTGHSEVGGAATYERVQAATPVVSLPKRARSNSISRGEPHRRAHEHVGESIRLAGAADSAPRTRFSYHCSPARVTARPLLLRSLLDMPPKPAAVERNAFAGVVAGAAKGEAHERGKRSSQRSQRRHERRERAEQRLARMRSRQKERLNRDKLDSEGRSAPHCASRHRARAQARRNLVLSCCRFAITVHFGLTLGAPFFVLLCLWSPPALSPS